MHGPAPLRTLGPHDQPTLPVAPPFLYIIVVGALCKITWPRFGGGRRFFCFRSIVPEKKTVRVARASSGFHIISPTRIFPSLSSSSSSSVTLFTVHIITLSGTRLVVCRVRIYHSRTCWATVLVVVDHLSVCVHFTIYFSRTVVSVKTHWIPLLRTCAPVLDVIDWNICSCRWSLDVVFCTRGHECNSILYYFCYWNESTEKNPKTSIINI